MLRSCGAMTFGSPRPYGGHVAPSIGCMVRIACWHVSALSCVAELRGAPLAAQPRVKEGAARPKLTRDRQLS